MITIYEKTRYDPGGELLSRVRKALVALQDTVDQIESSGNSAVTERAALRRLQARLNRLETEFNTSAFAHLH